MRENMYKWIALLEAVVIAAALFAYIARPAGGGDTSSSLPVAAGAPASSPGNADAAGELPVEADFYFSESIPPSQGDIQVIEIDYEQPVAFYERAVRTQRRHKCVV